MTRQPEEQLSFRPMGPDDLPLLETWLAEPHVSRWWDEADETVAAVTAPPQPGAVAVSPWIIELEARPVGFVQWYRVEPDDEWFPGLDIPAGTVGVDLALGREPARRVRVQAGEVQLRDGRLAALGRAHVALAVRPIAPEAGAQQHDRAARDAAVRALPALELVEQFARLLLLLARLRRVDVPFGLEQPGGGELVEFRPNLFPHGRIQSGASSIVGFVR